MAIGRVQRPAMNTHHRSTPSITSLNGTGTNTPSLAQTPTTASSSLSTSAEHTTPGYDFNTRPLPPRHDPSYSSSAGAAKGIELVMPHVAPPATPVMAGSAPEHVHFHGGVWEKQTVKKLPKAVVGEAKEGLGALFGGPEKSGEEK
jgi:ECL1/2/3 zinc binding proteins